MPSLVATFLKFWWFPFCRHCTRGPTQWMNSRFHSFQLQCCKRSTENGYQEIDPQVTIKLKKFGWLFSSSGINWLWSSLYILTLAVSVIIIICLNHPIAITPMRPWKRRHQQQGPLQPLQMTVTSYSHSNFWCSNKFCILGRNFWQNLQIRGDFYSKWMEAFDVLLINLSFIQ